MWPVPVVQPRHHRAATGPSRTVTVALAILVLSQMMGAFVAVRSGAGVPAVVLVPLATALLIGTVRLRERAPGPQIHDRQLDMIVAVVAGAGSAALIAAQLTGAGDQLGLLAVAPTAVAVLAAVVGTRRAWQARAVPAMLLLVWPAPWVALTELAGPGAVPVGGVAGLVVGQAVGLAAGTSPFRRCAALVAALGGAVGTAAVIDLTGPVVPLAAAAGRGRSALSRPCSCSSGRRPGSR
jgi:hypothetical protein